MYFLTDSLYSEDSGDAKDAIYLKPDVSSLITDLTRSKSKPTAGFWLLVLHVNVHQVFIFPFFFNLISFLCT
ncbi:hypothetical protein L1987_81316 [Smallanthus sonchifolius]|uniref:Uncharacterized protein n=1 Tax=Smallanthus sonchifolius TaxID=185202 RepID=A0ACB8YQV1_9ASTR|nr:hypothetical protein L1987_81316 [Smallanthus sonchifolius]